LCSEGYNESAKTEKREKAKEQVEDDRQGDGHWTNKQSRKVESIASTMKPS
jgi:hypothetical protein